VVGEHKCSIEAQMNVPEGKPYRSGFHVRFIQEGDTVRGRRNINMISITRR
jgi:hypothetical protein